MSGAVHFVVPHGIDDPSLPSGGNVYDRRIAGNLRQLGWTVIEWPAPGDWPHPDAAAADFLAAGMAALPDGVVVLLDGLIASAAARVLVPHAGRLRLVVLVHLPLGLDVTDGEPAAALAAIRSGEAAVLHAAVAVIATSRWCRRRLLELYRLPPAVVHVAEPGVDIAGTAPGTPSGGELLCVAAVTPQKGQDVLVTALTANGDLPWRCTFAGSLERDPGFAHELRRQARQGGIEERIQWCGALGSADLDIAYAAADVLLLASRGETYGMVVTEALARGVPVIASDVGGLPEALGGGPAGRPGLLVPVGDARRYAETLRRWLTESQLRQHLRAAARHRRASLTGWPAAADRVSKVLAETAA